MDVYESWGTHQPQTFKLVYTWTLENFALLKEMNEHLNQVSPKFPDDKLFKGPDDIKFHLKLNEDQDWLGLSVVPTCEKDCSGKVCKINIILSNNEECRKTSHFNINSGTYMWFSIHKYSELFAPENNLLPDGKLIIRVEITMMGHILCATGLGNPVKVPKCNLSEDFGALFTTGDFSDVTIKTADGFKLKAHKAILSARSTVFAAMFTHPMQESQENYIKIADFNGNVVSEMLRFIYTGEAPNLHELNEDLLVAADKYALDRLKVLSAESLRCNLSSSNAIRVYNLADIHNIVDLKTAATDYIYTHSQGILKSLNFRQLISASESLELQSAEEESLEVKVKLENSTKKDAGN